TEQFQTGREAETGASCASLGYASLACADHFALPEPLDWQAIKPHRNLEVSQLDCTDNLVRAQSAGQTGGRIQRETAVSAGAGVALASLVSTEAVSSLTVDHRAVGPGQLQARGAIAERLQLAPARTVSVLLLSGGDATLPLFPSWALPETSLHTASTMIDTAGYRASSYNCSVAPDVNSQPFDGTLLAPLQKDWGLRVSSFEPKGLWQAVVAINFSSVRNGGPVGECWRLNLNRYPHEVLQSLTRGPAAGWAGGPAWWLVTRQSYPWQRDNNAKGLFRVDLLVPERGKVPGTTTMDELQYGFDSVHQSRKGDAVLQDGAPLHSLMRGAYQMFQLYQQPGRPVQLVQLSLKSLKPLDNTYRLTEYGSLTGQARLLSTQQGELRLWMQQADSDLVKVYGLGARPGADVCPRLRQTIDLSGQPGGAALLARAGDWLYAVRQQEGQSASLRRWHLGTGEMDAHWQPDWAGNVTGDVHLTVTGGQVFALPRGVQTDVGAPNQGWQVQIPELGGCMSWARPALTGQAVPRPVRSAHDGPVTQPTETGPTGTTASAADWTNVYIGAFVPLAALALFGGGCAATGLAEYAYRKRVSKREEQARKDDQVKLVSQQETAVTDAESSTSEQGSETLATVSCDSAL
ncbi:MAG: hypothetical protein OXC07_12275, partial [Kistimonas sp.]|nr:hypothetical protein [Kistimonas sp.]